jgi:hypothetical protein
MYEIVSKYVKGCVMCATSKPRNKKLGLYMPLLVPSHPWESLSMDFVRGLIISRKGHDYLYVFMDIFNKMCVFVPHKKQVIGEGIVHFSFQHVWVHFGFLTSIVSD